MNTPTLNVTEGYRCKGNNYYVRYKVEDLFYSEHYRDTIGITHPRLEPNSLFVVSAHIVKLGKDLNYTKSCSVYSPAFNPLSYPQLKSVVRIIEDGVRWAIVTQTDPLLRNKYLVKNGVVTPNPDWGEVVEPEVIRDDSVLDNVQP